MKIAKVNYRGTTTTGVVVGDGVRILEPWSAGSAATAPFGAPGMTMDQLQSRLQRSGELLPLSAVTLVPPIGPASKLICLGVNYRDHAAEIDGTVAPQPTLFIKFADALAGAGEPIVRPSVSEHYDFEGEIAIVMGRPARHVSHADAMAHVFGYTIMMDGSVRDYQKHSVTAGKNFWQSGSLGPWIITADEVGDPATMRLETRLSGNVVQSTTADLMIYDIATAIEYVSRWTPLAPGDVISMGTPSGVGARRNPPLWMRDGDVIEVDVSPIGLLTNRVTDEHELVSAGGNDV